MLKRLILAYLLMLSCAFVMAQAKLVEKSPAASEQFTIPFTKYQLPNGLVVILHEDHSDPMVVVDVTYRVGSSADYPGRSGLAHFFEHLMFGGSKHVKDGEHMKLITEAGGKANGRTSPDKTSFTQTVPSSELERVLWLEADRMGFLLNTIDRERFEVQKKTILNERKQNIENVPGGKFYELAALNFYPPGHPYHKPSIGLKEEIEKISFEDLRNFYLQWFHPGNAILTIAGDVEPAQALQWVQKYFGAVPSRQVVQSVPASQWNLQATRYSSAKDNLMNEPYLVIKFPGVPKFHEDAPAMECLANILGDNRQGFLEGRLTKKASALYFGTYQLAQHRDGELNIFFVAAPHADLAALAKDALDVLQQFTAISPEMLQQKVDAFKTTMEFRKIYEAESLEGRVYNLSMYETMLGKTGFFHEELKRYKSIQPADVMRVYEKYVKERNAFVFSYVPEKLSVVKPQDTYTFTPVTTAAPELRAVAYQEPSDTFNRSAMPSSSRIKLPVSKNRHWTQRDSKTIQMMGAYNNETPVISFMLYMNENTPGIHTPERLRLLSYVLKDCGTKNTYPAQFFSQADRYGIYFDVQQEENTLAIQVKCLKKYLPQAVTMLKEKWQYAIFTDETVSAAKFRMEHECKSLHTNASQAADVAFQKMRYMHAAGLQPQLCDPSAQLSPTDLKEMYERLRTSSKLIICGDVEKDEALAAFSFLQPVKVQKPGSSEDATVNILHKEVNILPVEGAGQAELRMGYIIPEQYKHKGDMYRLLLANFILGGHFNSRLNTYLREQQGLTYRIFSYVSNKPDHTSFFIATSVDNNRLQEAVQAIVKQVDSFVVNGVTAGELQFLKSFFGKNGAISNEADFSKMRHFRFIMDNGLPADFANEQNEMLMNITLDELNAVIRKYIDPKKFNIVAAGDKQKIQEQLDRLFAATTK